MTISPEVVSQADVADVWPIAGPMLAEALDAGNDELTAEQLRGLIERGDAVLIVGVVDVAIVFAIAVEFTDYPNYRIGHIIAAGGSALLADPSAWLAVKQWLKSKGCRFVEAFAGESRARLFRRMGLHTVYHVVRSEL